jgi:hypothetical protein
MARKEKWKEIQQAKFRAEEALLNLVKQIEEYQTLPIDLERESKGIPPRKRSKATSDPLQRASKPSQSAGAVLIGD